MFVCFHVPDALLQNESDSFGGISNLITSRENIMLSFAHSYVALMIKIKVGIVNAGSFSKAPMFFFWF